MLKMPIKMPKSCRDCPFCMSEQLMINGGAAGVFHCILALNLQCFGGYDEKYNNLIVRTSSLVENIKQINKDCLLVKFNKQKAR